MTNTEPAGWRKCIQAGDNWIWRGAKLWHREAGEDPKQVPGGGAIQYWFVKQIYADQNRSPAVRRTLQSLLAGIPENGFGLNIGAGATRYNKVVNLEIGDSPTVDIVGHGTDLPFCDSTVDLVIMQEVLEHVDEYQELLSEVHRVLKPGGVCFCQVPFQIGYHPGPSDFWRFTRQGLEYLFRLPRWHSEAINISLGHGSGFYRIAVEFVAVTASCLWSGLYRPGKLCAALMLYPFKWFDMLTPRSAEKDRIPGGYFCVARKLAAVQES